MSVEVDRIDREQDAIEREFNALLEEYGQRQRYKKIDFYKPNPVQWKFHEAGKKYSQRALFGNNRGGKTTAGAAESTYHLRGIYPEDWPGHRFHQPVRGTVVGITAKQVRKSSQRVLMGDGNQWGTGMIPKEDVLEVRTVHGVSDAVDFARIRWRGGEGVSMVFFTSAEQDWEGQQGDRLDFGWFDEEPPPNRGMMLYDEVVTRTWDTNGIIMTTMTPQRGRTDFVNMFWSEMEGTPREGCKLFRMEIDDCTHLTPAMRERIKREVQERYPHMADARLRGIPTIGSGLIYQVPDEVIGYDGYAFDVTKEKGFRYLAGMDVGFANSFTAVVWGAMDSKSKTIYLWDILKIRQSLPNQIAYVIMAREAMTGCRIPVAWPKDAKQQEKSTGNVIRNMYEREGLLMLPEHASFRDERRDCVEEGIAECLMAMRDGRFKVSTAPHMQPWWNQKNSYSRDEEGKIVKTRLEQYDLMDAHRYMYVMMVQGYGMQARDPRRRSRRRARDNYVCLS